MSDERPAMQDPRRQYPGPPFHTAKQEPPGLASAMTPRPDHGEETYRGSGRLPGRKALITGGDSGVGRAVAIAFAREGADVAIGFLPSEQPDAREVAGLVEAEGRKCLLLPGDIREEKVCRKLVADAVAGLGGLDILVNNAAHQESRPSLADVTTEEFDATMKTNLYALFWITQEAVPHLPPGASIINTASVQAYHPSKAILAYALTKAGIVAFTKALSAQVIEKGVRANAVCPGPFWTPLQPSGGQPMDKLLEFGKQVPLGRPGQPAELAGVYVLLASQEASYITGEVYGVTGGAGLV